MPETPSAGELAVAVVGDLARGFLTIGALVVLYILAVELIRLHRRRLAVVRRATAQERAERQLARYLARTPDSSITGVRVIPAQRDREL